MLCCNGLCKESFVGLLDLAQKVNEFGPFVEIV